MNFHISVCSSRGLLSSVTSILCCRQLSGKICYKETLRIFRNDTKYVYIQLIGNLNRDCNCVKSPNKKCDGIVAQASERRCEELVMQVSESTRPLLRQIEAMQVLQYIPRRFEFWHACLVVYFVSCSLVKSLLVTGLKCKKSRSLGCCGEIPELKTSGF